jgi:multiple sugar transport system permease protein
MSARGISKPEKLLTHGVLIAGALIFAFPFLWMLGTSAKVRREMAAEDLRLLPRTPRPQMITPYIDREEFGEARRPDGVPEIVWHVAQPQLESYLLGLVEQWTPETKGPAGNAPPAPVDKRAYDTAMVRGLMKVLNGRLSDEARGKAAEFEKEFRSKGGARDVDPSGKLSNLAILAGVEAILADAHRLVDEDILSETFDSCYRRFCLGDVRVRTTDYESHSLYTGSEWRVAKGPATLVRRTDMASTAQEARIRFAPDAQSVTFAFGARDKTKADRPTPSFGTLDIDRVYVGYRGDASWAALTFEVVWHGKVYRTKSEVYLYDRDWLEQELRWPEGRGDPMQPRPYLILYPAGAASAGSPDLAVRVIVEKSSRWGAWAAKLAQNYRMAFREVPFARYIMTSLALAIINIVLAVFSCTIVAYAFARLEWPGRDLCFGILLATMMIPGQVTMIPSFLVARYLGWYNTLVPLWVYSAFGSAFFIFLVRQFLKNVPRDLEDAAKIDGCGFLRVYWHVMLPLVKPTIATIAIFTFMGVWNNFMGPLIYLNDERLFPLALGLFKFNLKSGSDVGLMMAGSFVMTLPIILLFFFVQRYFIQGISITGVKG